MRLPCAPALPVLLLLLALAGPRAYAAEADLHRLEVGGRVEAARAIDLDRDGRREVVLLVRSQGAKGDERQELVWIRIPRDSTKETFWSQATIQRVPLDEGPAARAGAIAVGQFGPAGEARLRLFTDDGVHDLTPTGEAIEGAPGRGGRTLLGRSGTSRLRFWDGHADLDGDGIEECWFPADEGSGHVRVLAGTPAGDRDLRLPVANRAATDAEFHFLRYARIPRLQPADLDADGTQELVAWDGEGLVAWSFTRGGAPVWRAPLPFDRPDLEPDEIYTPRLQLADVDGDRHADLLVTIVTGNRTQFPSFRTRLYHFAGPFYDPETRKLVAPSSRIDTESVALHPRFVDVDGDGALDYVCDAIRGTQRDLILRVLGQEPTIWHSAYRYLPETGSFAGEPQFSVERPYSREEAVSNRFGISAFFSGDFDGDGLRDMLDLGNLKGFEIIGAFRKKDEGPGDPVVFTKRLLPRVRAEEPLVADAVVADFDANGLADAAVWSESLLWLVIFRRTP